MALPDDVTVAPTDDVGQTLLPDHFDYLAGSGISEAYLKATPLIRSVETQADLPDYFREREDIVRPRGILFGWRTKDGSIEWQLRLDEPLTDPETGRVKKYLMRADSGIRYGLILKRSGSKVLIVEGTKQGHSVASAIDMNTSVIQIPGCTGWSRDGWQVPNDMIHLTRGRQVFILLDADAADNPDVYTAGEKLGNGLKPLAKSVRFVPCPGGGKSGIDDFLAEHDVRERKGLVEALVENATTRPASHRPSARAKLTVLRGGRDGEKSDTGYIGDQEWAWTPSGKLRYDMVSRHIMSEHPVALAGADQLAVYKDGAYSLAPSALKALVGRLLRDEMDTSRFNNLILRLLGVAHDEDARLRDRLDEPLVPVLNGVVDLRTGALLPHSPEYLLPYKLNIKYDPSAECPTYEKWLHASTLVRGHDQVNILEDVVSQMLDLASRPEKALFLVGPTRSGKSTFLRLLTLLAGSEMCSSTTLHQLSDDTFAGADLYGKLLNVDADMPDGYVPDVSIFKKLTGGEEGVRANPKHRTPFTFINSAMLAFSANIMPTVGEKSRAFVARSIPVSFPVSYFGKEDRALGKKLEAELPGIFNRWMMAWRARQARGGAFLSPNKKVMQEFEESVDAVHAFVREALWVWPQGGEGWQGEKTIATSHSTNWKSLFPLYEEWAARTNRGATNFRSFQERLLQVPGITDVDKKLRDTSKNKSYVVNVSPVPHADWGTPKIAILGKTTTPPRVQRIAAPVVEVPLVSLKDMGPIVLDGTTPAPAATAAPKPRAKRPAAPTPAPSVDWESTSFVVPEAVKGVK
ncbi:phage/plasmid primase [Mycobacteroides abscessus subsp. abscessus]|uniref:phage/plasmid primase, P4 family n=1 Tax=Mycobacteroides abscessus TaxID=36809 RepID=UPI0009A7708C|nr:phage/plasmid primase, P4 family [Mycobacteroides abscessus]SKF72893.1 phage/plasmid primase, P4 family, C-terminal domain [Mycobacteroides abscessus subsp. abscessus]SKX74394.1 phage/plasmid primase [Mycobacteroides abscessus subsp. abscessus]